LKILPSRRCYGVGCDLVLTVPSRWWGLCEEVGRTVCEMILGPRAVTRRWRCNAERKRECRNENVGEAKSFVRA
jgi:hypothetical protein